MSKNKKYSSKSYMVFPPEVEEMNVYLAITLKTVNNGDFFENMKNQISSVTTTVLQLVNDVTKNIVAGTNQFIGLDNNAKNVKTLFNDLNGAIENVNQRITGGEDGFMSSTEKFTFFTYVPEGFESSIHSSWESSNVIGGIGSVLGNLDIIPMIGGSLQKAYNLLKGNAELASGISINPRQMKIFRPNFFDFSLKYKFIPKNKDEAIKLHSLLNLLRESQIPSTVYNNAEELFTFPAVFDIDVIVRGEDENITTTKKSNKNIDTIWKHITQHKGFGLNSLDIKPMSGDSHELQLRPDGTAAGYEVSMNFTSLRKLYSKVGMDDRIAEILNKLD
jgi:hypothetical protein